MSDRLQLKSYAVVRVNNDDADTYAVLIPDPGDVCALRTALVAALDLAGPDTTGRLQYAVVKADDAGMARLMGTDWATVPASVVGDYYHSHVDGVTS